VLDFFLTRGVFEGVAAGSHVRLEAAQTSHATDLALARFAEADPRSIGHLMRWMTDGASAVLRVNAAGVLAKIINARPQRTVLPAPCARMGRHGRST
jgi:hypothetical protein